MPNKHDNKKNKIFVMGDLREHSERSDLITTISSSGNSIQCISFLDAVFISEDVLKAMSQYNFLNSKEVKIDVFNNYLYSYLFRLGIKNVNLRNKDDLYNSNQKRKPQNLSHSSCDIKKFLSDIKKKYDYDFSQYRFESISRRISIAMMKTKFEQVEQYMDEVLNNQIIFDDLVNNFLINVTEFFRNPEVFSTIRKKVLTSLDSFPNIKIWCAGCSTGEEAYSLAIMLSEYGILDKSIIYATDISANIINEAKNGCFSIEKIKAAEKNYSLSGCNRRLSYYFENNGYYTQVKRCIRDKILFFQHSLLDKEISNEINLIFCRNVLIYFNMNLQRQVLESLKSSLVIEGILVLGESENLAAMNTFGFLENVDIDKRIFKNSHNH